MPERVGFTIDTTMVCHASVTESETEVHNPPTIGQGTLFEIPFKNASPVVTAKLTVSPKSSMTFPY